MRIAVLIFLFASISAPANGAEMTFDRYHSQQEISEFLRSTADTHSDIVSFHNLGVSGEGREISYLVIGTPGKKKDQKIYINGTHHGNEKSSTEAVLATIDYLTKNKNYGPVASLLSHFEFYLQPLINPDGHASNTRGDADGHDPNRDYLVFGSNEANAFSLPETRLVKKLFESVRFEGAIAFHSGMEGVLWPWCHSSLPTRDQDRFSFLAEQIAKVMGFGVHKQSWRDYPTNGEFTDYAYQHAGTFGVTVEVSKASAPEASELQKIVDRAAKGVLAFAQGIRNNHNQKMALETGAMQEVPFQNFMDRKVLIAMLKSYYQRELQIHH